MTKITWQGDDDEVKAEYNGMNLVVQKAGRLSCWYWDVTRPMKGINQRKMISYGQHRGDIKTAILLCELVARAEVNK